MTGVCRVSTLIRPHFGMLLEPQNQVNQTTDFEGLGFGCPKKLNLTHLKLIPETLTNGMGKYRHKKGPALAPDKAPVEGTAYN